jgi:polar amino acid transport system substrate-binding protein
MSLKTLSLSLALGAAALAAAVPARADQLADIMGRGELRCGTFADVPPTRRPARWSGSTSTCAGPSPSGGA